MKKKTTEEIIELAKNTHGDFYIYDKTIYKGKRKKIIITCPIHGDFEQYPYDHIHGCGCQECANIHRREKRLKEKEQFIKDARKIHGNKYDYSLVDYKGSDIDVIIICPIHGKFKQKPKHHLLGSGCQKCGKENCSEKQRLPKETILKRSKETHNNKYKYLPLNNLTVSDRMGVICPIHGIFVQRIEDHMRGCGCPSCSNQNSKAEEEICSLLNGIKFERRNRDLIDGKEIDIYIPSIKLGIEYNGLRWHTDFGFGRDKNYHINKLQKCNEQGIKLIQIFEDEWINHREIVESKLKHIIGIDNNKPKIFARNCEVKVINYNDAKKFLEKNHIQGETHSTIYLGLYYNNSIVAVMSFLEEKENMWNLNRFATNINYNCIGAGGKLFKFFINNYSYKEIKSFADRRWTTDVYNNLYTKLGFTFNYFTKPDYTYFNPKIDKYKRFHKFGFRKQTLHRKYNLPLSMTETEMIKSLDYDRIWDCGLIKYIYKNEK